MPRESKLSIPLNTTYWLHLNSEDNDSVNEMKHIAAEPIYLCGRSNDWRGNDSSKWELLFRSAYIRYSDRQNTMTLLVIHLLVMLGMSILWLCPYISTVLGGLVGYYIGLKYFITICSACVVILFLTPLMIRKR